MDSEIQNVVDGAEEYRESLDAAVERLAGLSQREYEQCRRAEAKKLDVRAAWLDQEVCGARPGNDDDGGLELYEPEPWPEEVDGDDLLDQIVSVLRRYVVMPSHAAEAAALWVVHTHGFDFWQITPRLAIGAPTKGAGKSVLLDVVGNLVPRPLAADNLTPAVVFRAVDRFRPVLLADEVDTFVNGDNRELLGILNSGHRKGGQALRCEGDDHALKAFATFCPVATAGIGRLPGTLADRSIHVRLLRKRADEIVESFRGDRVDHLRNLARQAARFVTDNEVALRDADPDMPSGIFNRTADNWRALLAIADAAGGDWPARARQAATSLSATAAGEDDSIREQLIGDIFLVFETTGRDRIPSNTLVEELVAMDDRPWPDYKRGKAISPQQIARLLKPFGITSGSIRLDDGMTPKGYKKSAFNDAFRRYPPMRAATTPQATDTAGYSYFQVATNGVDVAAVNRLEPALSNGCGVVAARMGGCGPITSTEPVSGPACAHCHKPVVADDEIIPVAGGGELHGRCYQDWFDGLEPRGTG